MWQKIILWIRNNILNIVVIVVLISIIVFGSLYFGGELSKSKSLAAKLSEDIGSANELVTKQQLDIEQFKSDIERSGIEIEQLRKDKRILLENNSQLVGNNIELTKTVETIRGNLEEAVRILGTAKQK